MLSICDSSSQYEPRATKDLQMRRMPPLSALRVFDAVIRNTSMRDAARELERSDNAVSHQISQIKDYFGQDMFEKKGGRLQPTQAAKSFSNDIRTAFDLIAAASEKFAARKSENTITINATQSFSLRWLIPRISAFQLKYPEINIKLHTSVGDGVSHLDQPYDFIFRKNHLRLRDHSFFRLMPDNATPVMSPEFFERHTFRSPEDVLNHQLLHMKTRPIAWHIWLSEFASLNSDVLPGTYYDHYYLAIEATLNRTGIALIPLYLINDELAEKRLIAPLPFKECDWLWASRHFSKKRLAVPAQGAFPKLSQKKRSRDPSRCLAFFA